MISRATPGRAKTVAALTGVLMLAAGAWGPARAVAVAPGPPVTAGLQLWYEADTETEPDGAAVMSWADKSGRNRDLTAFDSGAAPVMRRGAINGRAAIEFNGSTSMLKTYRSTFTLAQPDTVFIVYRALDAAGSSRAFVFDSRDSSVRQTLGRPDTGLVRLYANYDLDAGPVAYPFPGFQIWSARLDGAGSALYRNGNQMVAGNAGTSGLTGFALGGLSTSDQYGYDFARFAVAEVLYYTGALAPADRDSVTAWLNRKYGVIAKPADVTPPTVTGLATLGSPLSATTGTWTGDPPITYSFQWRRCALGLVCTDVAGATSSTYTVGLADLGSTLAVTVTARNVAGSASATSDPTAPVV